MAHSLCKVMGRGRGGVRSERERELGEGERERETVAECRAERRGLDGEMVTADMIEKMTFENHGVCLISVYDGLSPL